MSTWNTTSTNSRFGSTGVGLRIGESSSTASSSRRSPSNPSPTSPWSSAPLSAWNPTTTCSGYLSEVNTHLAEIEERIARYVRMLAQEAGEGGIGGKVGLVGEKGRA